MAYVKLDTGILDSSIWCESTDTRLLWIVLLVMANQDGLVASTAPGIARRAGLSLEATRQGLEILEGPDADSKSPENEGRRIQRVDGGFLILNYEKYRRKDHTNAERQKRHRALERERNALPPLREPLRNARSASAYASASESALEEKKNPGKSPTQRGKGKGAELDQLAEHVLAVLKIPMSDKAETEKLLKAFGLDYMKAAVERMAAYFEAVRENGWTKYIIGRHWRNLYEKLEYFSTDENLQRKLRDMGASGEKKSKPDYSTWDSLNAEQAERPKGSRAIGQRPLSREAEAEQQAAADLAAESEPEPKTAAERLEELRRGRDAMQPWDARRGSFDREIERLTKQIAEGA